MWAATIGFQSGIRTSVMVVMSFSQIPFAGARYSESGMAYRFGR
jgi:hypothetical protein